MSTIEFLKRIPKSFLCIIGLVIILGANFLINHEQLFLDVWDETHYLSQIYDPLPTWSPLYSIYYRVLSLFVKTNLNLYDLSFFLISCVLSPCAFYLSARKLNFAHLTSFFASLFLCLTSLNFVSYPYIHKFNFLFFFFLYLFLEKKSWGIFLLFFMWGNLLYLRVENFISFAIFLSLTSLVGLPGNIRRTLLRFATGLCLFGAGFFVQYLKWGSPIEDRVRLAFIDHYIWQNPEMLQTIDEFTTLYPLAKSYSSFIFHYPGAFLSHALKNFFEMNHVLLNALKTSAPTSDPSSYLVYLPEIFLGITIFFLLTDDKRKKGREWLTDKFVIFLAAFAIQNLALCLLLSPYVKYIPTLVCFLVIGVIPFLLNLQKLNALVGNHLRHFRFVLIAALSLLAFLHITKTSKRFLEVQNRSIHNRLQVKLIKEANIVSDETVLLTVNLLSNYFFDFARINQALDIFSFATLQDTSFANYMVHSKINLFCDTYLSTPTPLSYVSKERETSYNHFRANYSEYGFERLPIGDADSYAFFCYKKKPRQPK